MSDAYIVKVDRVIRGEVCARAGDTVYRCRGWDYGCANDDTAVFGVEHISVTLDPEGGYPFFTIARSDLLPVASPDAEASA